MAELNEDTRSDLVGTVLDRYEILRKIGEGGMGAVYEAEHTALRTRVAVKVLLNAFAKDKTSRLRFLREARAASAIHCEQIVRITDFGTTAEGTTYFVMEYIEGQDLQRMLKTHGRLPWSRARPILMQIATALDAAHAQGVVHRDVKPGNVIVFDDPGRRGADAVKVVDFGIAKLNDATDELAMLTQTGQAIGTPAYMAPELARGITARPSADLYAFGVLAFRMLAGRLPFEGRHALEMFAAHLQDAPPLPTTFEPSISATVEGLILRCLAKEPTERYADMSEIVAHLAAIDDDGHGPNTITTAQAATPTTTQPFDITQWSHGQTPPPNATVFPSTPEPSIPRTEASAKRSSVTAPLDVPTPAPPTAKLAPADRQEPRTRTPSLTPNPTTLTPAPTPAPTTNPTPAPTPAPTTNPTPAPTPAPTTNPTPAPTPAPTTNPTPAPTPAPTTNPTPAPTPTHPSSKGERSSPFSLLLVFGASVVVAGIFAAVLASNTSTDAPKAVAPVAAAPIAAASADPSAPTQHEVAPPAARLDEPEDARSMVEPLAAEFPVEEPIVVGGDGDVPDASDHIVLEASAATRPQEPVQHEDESPSLDDPKPTPSAPDSDRQPRERPPSKPKAKAKRSAKGTANPPAPPSAKPPKAKALARKHLRKACKINPADFTISALITPSGTVLNVTIKGGTQPDHDCIKRTLKSQTFPSGQGRTIRL